jgi:hypothetical protein
MARGNHSFEELAGFTKRRSHCYQRGDAVLTHAGVVSSQFFHLNRGAVATRSLYGGRRSAGAAPTLVVTGEFWAKSLG